MERFKIALTGGPCAGKTKILEEIIKHINKNYLVNLYVIPETATELINEGISPLDYENPIDFQNIIFSRQMNKEETTKTSIMKRKGNFLNSVVICDRGVIDNKAYLDSMSDFDSITSKYRYSEINLLDDYDLVIDLISTANSDYGIYDTTSNEARYESEEDARTLDIKTSTAWIGHRNLKIIDCMEDLESKKEVVLKKIDQLLQNKQETILRKHPVDISSSDFTIYTDDNSKTIDIEETILDIENKSNFDYKIIKRTYKESSSYLLVVEKEFGSKKEIIFDKVIDEGTSQSLKLKAGIKEITNKKRLSFIENKQIYNIDFYDDECILELPLEKEDKLIVIPNNIKSIDKNLEKPKIKTL